MLQKNVHPTCVGRCLPERRGVRGYLFTSCLLLMLSGFLFPANVSAQNNESEKTDSAGSQSIDSLQVTGKVGSAIDKYMQRAEAFGFDGVVLAELDGQIVIHKGYGFADRNRLRPNSATTIFDVGSIAKTLTAATIMRLVNSGRLRLDATLSEILSGVPEEKSGIRLEQLLTHTSGFRRGISLDQPNATHQQVLTAIMASQLADSPGSKYQYSNMGYVLLAAIIEKKSRVGWQASMRESMNLAELKHTGFYQDLPGDRIARSYLERDDDGTAADWRFDWAQTGNGHVLSTTGDLYRWIEALERGRVVDPESWKLMTTPYRLEGNEQSASEYGMGVEVSTDKDGHLSIGHSGDYRGYHCVLKRFSNPKATLVICCNEGFVYSGLGNHRIVQSALTSILHDKKPGRSFPVARMITPQQSESLVGNYRIANENDLSVMYEAGRLWIAPNSQPATNALLAFDDETKNRCDVAFDKTVALLKAIKKGDDEVALKVPEGAQMLANLNEYLNGQEVFPETTVLAGLPVTWSPNNVVRVFVKAKRGSEVEVFHLGWKGGRLFDVTIWDHLHPQNVAVALGENEGSLVICDPWTKRTRHFRFDTERLIFELDGKTIVAKRQKTSPGQKRH